MSLTLRNLVLSALFASTAVAQCYWPDGSQTADTDSVPCSEDNAGQHLDTFTSLAICCPPQWKCMPEGICQNPAAEMDIPSAGEGQYGRYACTSSDWSSCPRVCLDPASLAGAESILQCTDGVYCCDRNRQAGNCCYGEIPDNDPPYFSLNNGIIAGLSSNSSGSEIPSTSSGGVTASGAPTSSIPVSSTPEASTPLSDPASISVGQETTSIATDASGSVRTIFVTPTSTPTPNADGGSKSNTGAIVGGVVGGVCGAALIIGGIALLLWRRRVQQRKNRQTVGDDKFDAPESPPSAPFMKGEWNESAVSGVVEADSREKAEIDGFPVQKQTKYGELGSKVEHGGSTPIIELPTTEK